jgi:hypothetical protein
MKKNSKTFDSTKEILPLLSQPTAKYEARIKEMDDEVMKFSKQAYDLSLNIDDLKKLKRKIIKAANFCENIIKDDKRFAQWTSLNEAYIKQGEEAAKKLRGLTTVIDASIEDLKENVVPGETTNPRTKLLLLRELGLLNFLYDKLSERKNGTLNDREISEIIQLITGAYINKDLQSVLYNQKNSKNEFPINKKSVREVERLLAPYGLQVKNLPIKSDKD